MPKHFFISGANGFIGRALCKELVKAGHRVRGLDNGFRSTDEEIPGVESVKGDVRHAGFVKHVSEGADAVVHLAYINGTQNFYDKPELVLDVAVRGMLSVLDACRANNIRELHLVSSSEVYQDAPVIPTAEDAPYSIPNPLNPRYSYACGKQLSEMMAINFGRTGFDRVTITRPNNVYGKNAGRDHVIPQFIMRMKELTGGKIVPYYPYSERLRFPIQGTGGETRAYCWIGDMVAAMMTVIEKGEHLNIYHAGDDRNEISTARLALLIGACFGRQLEIVPGELLKGSPKRRCPDISKLRALGYEPRMPLEEGLNLVVREYLQCSSTI